ncbi:MAG: sulfatase-like hydrolase/transferase [Anaerolineales bacterium]|nr:sulfatase-like hydrolase/transferase [Anaerolineales bacterium]
MLSNNMVIIRSELAKGKKSSRWNPKKNILILFNDDHAQWASGTYGNSEIQTPNIDHLAATGIQMQNAFTPTPVCSPARACFLTGKLASQHGIHDYLSSADPEIDSRDWLAGEVILPEILAAHGYQVGYSGKWHLGQDDTPHPAFDDWFSISGDYPFRHKGTTRFFDRYEDPEKSGLRVQQSPRHNNSEAWRMIHP